MFAIGAALDVGARAQRLFAEEQPPSSRTSSPSVGRIHQASALTATDGRVAATLFK